MTEVLKYQVVSDGEIEDLFDNINFGKAINGSIHLKRLQLLKSVDAKFRGCHVGHSMFCILTHAGLVHDNKEACLTGRGSNFLLQEKLKEEIK